MGMRSKGMRGRGYVRGKEGPGGMRGRAVQYSRMKGLKEMRQRKRERRERGDRETTVND